MKLILMLLFISSMGFAQKEPVHSITFDSKINDLYLHNITGIPIITTNSGVYGIDGESGTKLWEFKEADFINTLNALGQGAGSSFNEIPLSPFGEFNQTIFDIKTGEKILDTKTNVFKKILDTEYIFNKKAILFFTQTDKTEGKLFLISIENKSILWETEITSKKKLNNLIGTGGMSNFIQNENRIAFSAGKTIFLINEDDGKVILTEKYDAGELFFSENNKHLIAVENKNNSLVGGVLKAGFTMGASLFRKRVIGKELIAFDTNTGKKIWKKSIELDEGFVDYQFEDEKLFLIHEEGAKLYDYHTGKESWKKEFKQKKVKGVEKTDEGYMVYYKNKKHLVDNTGKKIWKKPEKVIKNVNFEVDEDEDFTSFSYDSGTLFITPYRIEYFRKGEEKRVYKISLNQNYDKLAYDKKNNNLILLSGKKLYVLNPDKNLGKDQVKKIDFNESDRISTIGIREKGYFINSNWEYVIVDFKGNTVKKEHFKQPGEGLRHLKNIGSYAVGVAGAASEISGVTNIAGGATIYGSGAFVGNQAAKNQGEKYLKRGGKQYANSARLGEVSNYLWDGTRHNAYIATKNNAFFYTTKNSKKVLLQVNKDTGDIIDSYEFGINNPKYKIDKPSKLIYFRKGKELKVFSYN